MAVTPATTEPVDATEGERSRDLEPSPPRQAGIDRFDDAIVVTRTRAWIGLAAALVMVAAVIVWASLAEVYKTVPATGVALANGALAHVDSPVTGVITELKVSVQQYVTAGQTLGTVSQANGQTAPIVAQVSGQVLQINQGVGTRARAEQPVISVAQTSGKVVVRTFVTARESQLLRVGTPVRMDFPGESQVPGRVSEIGNVPLSAVQVAYSLGASSLAQVVLGGLASSLGATSLAQAVKVAGEAVSVVITPERHWTRHFDGFDVASLTFIYGHQHPIAYAF